MPATDPEDTAAPPTALDGDVGAAGTWPLPATAHVHKPHMTYRGVATCRGAGRKTALYARLPAVRCTQLNMKVGFPLSAIVRSTLVEEGFLGVSIQQSAFTNFRYIVPSSTVSSIPALLAAS